METLKEVQEYVDKQIKVLEGKKELLVSLERLYEVLSKQKSLADYTIEIKINLLVITRDSRAL